MYSEGEIDAAVSGGALSPEAAAELRAHVSRLRRAPAADEEQFRLVTGFNDIFVAIAGILVLVGAGWLGGAAAPWIGGVSGAGFAVAIIVIGASLLMLSAFWQAMRRTLVPRLPEAIRDRVPLPGPLNPRSA